MKQTHQTKCAKNPTKNSVQKSPKSINQLNAENIS